MNLLVTTAILSARHPCAAFAGAGFVPHDALGQE